ncbi:MAG: hypothetical protein JGK21_02900 [Microcoleus sp. PH2017_22_RUC_O_B]|uniref:hypothetical protein n=1 Tax=unclassified Microcoleus TaxID=2642155 RepID=UPI001D2ABEDB|nr:MULTISPECIES: hypothetical protein [unclassified Microcoleus]MCC3527164.1 hypothetical protein [Microcoleus sp. PH2017_21_RUC_O_A]MCC3539345.1 hypothetical protein [Microcoleus sp. PH2017_22_RUC_O_B]
MSVNVLYCEGGKNSPDIRVLLNVLSGICTVRPAGSKYGLDRQILFIKQEQLLPNSIVAALKDRDFDNDESPPVNFPRNWLARVHSQDIQVGWSWERKEIENYLIDPEVVSHALGSKAPPIEDYRAALEESAKTIADYTAARIALSISHQPLLPLKNCWGNMGGQHPFPERLAESDCRVGITDVVRQYEQAQILLEDNVLVSFEQLLSICRVGGCRFQNFLTFFSGKDLLCGMRSALIDWGLGEPFVFRERIVKGIENSTENVSSWVPEWDQLRQIVQNFSP